MKSTSGTHFIALDHIRAFAAYLVFSWHFLHTHNGQPISFEYVPSIFPFALLDEGHTGVSLFMVLSGYLFGRLLEGKKIHFGAFLWNRALRLLPLFLLIIAVRTIVRMTKGESGWEYLLVIAQGIVFPGLPNGGWSLTVEFHFYLLLPFLLWVKYKSTYLLLPLLGLAVALRWFYWSQTGEVQSIAYWTIFGRIDQFLLGLIACQFREKMRKQHYLFAMIAVMFSGLYWYFDRLGGFNNMPSYPSPTPLWIILPTLEGFAYAAFISWYETSFTHRTNGISKFIGKIGEYSYSIYLLHFFIVFAAAKLISTHTSTPFNFYIMCLWSTVFFLLMMPLGYLSYRFVESPFLRFRRKYTS
jgi:peptidoglycan/LPS O-acetylase OafA/YrhL